MQNISDAAALAGATDLGTNVDASQQQAAITDALSTVLVNLGVILSPNPSTCGAGYCDSISFMTSGKSYTVSASTPPQSASSSNETVNDLEVNISTTISNGFAGVIGFPNSKVTAHSVAYHSGLPGVYNYSFFTNQDIETGSQQTVLGDAYVGDTYQSLGQGHSGLCVYNPTGTTTKGHIVFAVYPPATGIEPKYGYTGLPWPRA